MHENVTHNRDYKTFNDFRREIIKFLRYTVPRRWDCSATEFSDHSRVTHRADFRVIAQPPYHRQVAGPTDHRQGLADLVTDLEQSARWRPSPRRRDAFTQASFARALGDLAPFGGIGGGGGRRGRTG